MKVEKIDHIAISVRDLEKAKRFFADVLGTEFGDIGEVNQIDSRSAIDPTGIELVAPLTPDGPVAKTIERRGEGLSLLSLEVKNLDEAIAEIESRGIRVLGRLEMPRMVLGEKVKWQRRKRRVAVLHPKDTYNVMIELLEYLE